jgi:hypothetical protein
MGNFFKALRARPKSSKLVEFTKIKRWAGFGKNQSQLRGPDNFFHASETPTNLGVGQRTRSLLNKARKHKHFS